eukprot:m51a1_g3795 hypothetical protein (273) ;mRNA; r:192328-193146
MAEAPMDEALSLLDASAGSGSLARETLAAVSSCVDACLAADPQFVPALLLRASLLDHRPSLWPSPPDSRDLVAHACLIDKRGADPDYVRRLQSGGACAVSPARAHVAALWHDYVRDSVEDAVPLYAFASARGLVLAKVELACCYECGLGGVEQDVGRARELRECAMAAGSVRATSELGWTSATDGSEPEARRGMELLQEAAALEFPDSMMLLSWGITNRLGGLDDDPERARELIFGATKRSHALRMMPFSRSVRAVGSPFEDDMFDPAYANA